MYQYSDYFTQYWICPLDYYLFNPVSWHQELYVKKFNFISLLYLLELFPFDC